MVKDVKRRALSIGMKAAGGLAVVYLVSCGVVFAVMHQRPPTIGRFFDRLPGVLWAVLPMQTMWAAANRGELEPGDVAPDFDLPALDGRSRVRLSSLRGRPVALFFGSYTCPPFRRKMPDMNRLYEPYRDRLQFYFIYIEEAHATDSWPVESNTRDGVLFARASRLEERVKAGAACSMGLKIPFPMLVDDLDDRVGRTYRAWPIRVYLIGGDGQIAFKTRPGPYGFDAEELRPEIERLLKR